MRTHKNRVPALFFVLALFGCSENESAESAAKGASTAIEPKVAEATATKLTEKRVFSLALSSGGRLSECMDMIMKLEGIDALGVAQGENAFKGGAEIIKATLAKNEGNAQAQIDAKACSDIQGESKRYGLCDYPFGAKFALLTNIAKEIRETDEEKLKKAPDVPGKDAIIAAAKANTLPPERMLQHHFDPAAGIVDGGLEEECVENGGKWTRDIEVVSATAKEVFDDFQANEIRANNKYKGKTVLVSGKVAGVDADMMDKPLVKLRTSNQFMSVGLKDIPADKASELDKGDSIKALCSGAAEVGGTPFLAGCVIQ